MCNTFIDLKVKHHSFCQKKIASDLRKYHLSWLSANTMNNIRCKTYLNVFLKLGCVDCSVCMQKEELLCSNDESSGINPFFIIN